MASQQINFHPKHRQTVKPQTVHRKPFAANRLDWRYERKFRLENIPRHLALQIVRLHPAGFRTAFPDRWVNNLYLDDSDLTALQDNFAGIADRQKVRLRWYGDTFPSGEHPAQLEWKIRSNQLGTKRVVEVPAASFDSLRKLREQVHAVWPAGDAYRFTLFNRYRRSYLTAAAGRIRLTIDWNLSFSEPNAAFLTRKTHLSPPGGILELKYPPEEETYAGWIMQQLPFRVYKHSKYVGGLLALPF